jgi:Smg protein
MLKSCRAVVIYEVTRHAETTENDLVEELLSVGFEAEEIDAAFCWMESQALCAPVGSETSLNIPSLSHRVFTTEENRALSPEARGFLTRLRTMGILDDEVQEEVIDKALLMAEDEVTLKEIKTITVLAMFAYLTNKLKAAGHSAAFFISKRRFD